MSQFADDVLRIVKLPPKEPPARTMTEAQFQDWWQLIEAANGDLRQLRTLHRQIVALPESPRRNDLLETLAQLGAELAPKTGL